MIRITGLLFLSVLAAAQPEQVLQSWKADAQLKNASIAYCIMDASSGSLIAEYNSSLALVPGSTLKLLTTAAVTSWLGPSYHYDTRLLHSGNFDREAGVLYGEMLI